MIDTSELLTVHPDGVDLSRSATIPTYSEPTGLSGDPKRASTAYGSALLDIRINAAVRQIRAAMLDRNASNQGLRQRALRANGTSVPAH